MGDALPMHRALLQRRCKGPKVDFTIISKRERKNAHAGARARPGPPRTPTARSSSVSDGKNKTGALDNPRPFYSTATDARGARTLKRALPAAAA